MRNARDVTWVRGLPRLNFERLHEEHRPENILMTRPLAQNLVNMTEFYAGPIS